MTVRALMVKDESGQAMVEWALVFPVCFVAFIALFEFGFMLYANAQLSSVAKNCVNYAVVHGQAADAANPGSGCGPGTNGGLNCSAIVDLVKAQLAQYGINGSSSAATVCGAWWSNPTDIKAADFLPSACPNNFTYQGSADIAKPGSMVSVQVVWNYQPFTQFVPISIPLSYTATGAVVY
jgi:hypothetical protein